MAARAQSPTTPHACEAPRCRAFARWRVITPHGDRLHACAVHIGVVIASAGFLSAVVEAASIAPLRRTA
jgi:hypothetical protein